MEFEPADDADPAAPRIRLDEVEIDLPPRDAAILAERIGTLVEALRQDRRDVADFLLPRLNTRMLLDRMYCHRQLPPKPMREVMIAGGGVVYICSHDPAHHTIGR